MEDLTCDEDCYAGQGQPSQVILWFRYSGVVNLGHQGEVYPERCGAYHHGDTLVMKRGQKTSS